MRKFLLSLLLFSTAFGLVAQERKITGVVSDNFGPAAGASVRVENTNRGAIAGSDGEFTISVANGETVVISFSGLETKRITINAGTPDHLTVNLEDDVKVVQEIVITGAYGVQRKSDMTGSTSRIGADKMRESVATSLDQAMQGRSTGVQVTQGSGQPGEAANVTIRGISSLGNNQPLYVVDGMPMNNSGDVSSNPLASINPADIVSMDILKDASATAIYGSRAANGVIMITTRKGQDGEARISYDGQISLSQLPKKVDMMNLREFAEYKNSTIDIFGLPDDNLQRPEFLGKGTDWQDELYRLGISHNHQVSVSGGDAKTIYAISMGYGDQEGIVINTDFQRFNGRINLETQAKDWLKVGVNMAYTHINKTSLTSNDGALDEGIIISSLLSLPSNPVKNIDGNFSGPENENGVKLNPIALALIQPVKRKEQNVLGNIYTQVQFYKDLSWRTEFGFDYTRAEEEQFYPTYVFGVVKNDRSELERLDANNFYWRASSFMNYIKDFKVNGLKNSVNGMVGVEASEASFRGTTPSVFDLLSNSVPSMALGSNSTVQEFKGSNAMASAFARAVYNYGDRYLLTATGRFDGSSNFAAGNQWGFFPSLGFAWRVENERFAKSEGFRNIFSAFKVRLGYGETGNANATPAHRGYVQLQENKSGVLVVQQVNYTNPNLKWETNFTYNVGLDLGFGKQGRINLTADAFYKENQDLLLAPELPAFVSQATGDDNWMFMTTPYVNAGSIRNVGYELSLNTQNIKTEKFTWETNINFTQVKNTVISTGVTEDPIRTTPAYRYRTIGQYPNRTAKGEAPGKFWGYKVEGIVQNTQQLMELKSQGRTAIGTQVGDLIFSEEEMFIGDPNPLFTGGIGNTFTYGPWSLTIFFTGSYGNDVFNMTKMKTEGMDSEWVNQTTSVKDFARVVAVPELDFVDANGNDVKYYKVENSNTSMPRPDTEDANGNVGKISDRYVEDGSYIRLQNISLTYTLPAAVNKKLHINNLRVTANAQNVYTFTKYSGYDPEVMDATRGVLGQGVDTGRYPSPRMYSLSLGFEF